MRKFFLMAAVLLALPAALLKAQTDTLAYEMVDSLVYLPTAAVDSSLVGKGILEVLPSRTRGDAASAHVYQSARIASDLQEHIRSNASKTISGYRVRIFFDNKQDSRTRSEETLRIFKSRYPGVAAYRSYTTPFFKVTVGDLRTRSEAVQLFQWVVGDFPSAFIVKEKINYPVVDREHSYTVDTLRVRRYLEAPAAAARQN